MPSFRAVSRTVNLASPSMISFIFETFSLRDIDFGLPDFGAFTIFNCVINRGSNMSHVLLNLLNELVKRDKMRGLPSILSLFRNEFNKFNNTRARMLDSIYHMTLRYL